jgi:hypothetical protein
MTTPPVMPMRIAAIGMDQRQRNALRLLFTSKCGNRYLLVEESSAELCILDLDAFGGERLWQEFRQRHTEQPLILVSLKAQTLTDSHTLFVRKPILVDQLIAAIEQQRNRYSPELMASPQALNEPAAPMPPPAPRQQHHKPAARKAASIMSTATEQVFVGTAPDIDPLDPQQKTKIYYNPDHYLQGHLQQALNLAVRQNRNVTIKGPWPKLDLFIEPRRILVAANERHLRPYCTLPDTTLGVDLQLFDGEARPTDQTQDYPLAAFFWQLALWASRGRLPQGTSLTQPIYLRRWPNFTRLVVTPYALAIAALWAEQPRSLLDTAKDLQIPQRYVFAFYSAARSLQLAGETRRAVDTLLAPPEIVQTKERGLFGRLLDRIRGDAPR